MNLNIRLLIVLLGFVGCHKTDTETHWLLGNWCSNNPTMNAYENWTLKDYNHLIGESFVLVQSDTVFFEKIDLQQTKKGWEYVVTVRNQNNEQPVHFLATSICADSLVFENRKHDYPNRIVYKKINNDSLVACIFGYQNGKATTEVFPMKKIHP